MKKCIERNFFSFAFQKIFTAERTFFRAFQKIRQLDGPGGLSDDDAIDDDDLPASDDDDIEEDFDQAGYVDEGVNSSSYQ